MKEFNKIIKKIGEVLGIKITLLSDNWTTVLEKNHKIHYITGYQFDLNNHGIGNIMDDKGLFWDLLKYKNIPIINQYVIFHNYDKNNVLKYFSSCNNEIIVKGNIGNAGKEVFKVNDEEKLFLVIDELLLKEYSVSLCPFYRIKNEYRVIILNNQVRLIFGKIKPTVIGDGKRTVKELAIEYNSFYQEHSDKIPNPNYIPKESEQFELSYKFNLSAGGKTFLNINPDLKTKITNLALHVAKELNIIFASVDIIHTENNELLVMEANSGVTMNKFITQNSSGYDIAYSIYRDAIRMMFDT